jgi:hypothetical protein
MDNLMKVERDFNHLIYNKPFPLTQSKQTRNISILYLAVATGSLENVKLILKELERVDIEVGIEIKKRFKGVENEIYADNFAMVGLGNGPMNEKYIKKRTPLQLACGIGLY